MYIFLNYCLCGSVSVKGMNDYYVDPGPVWISFKHGHNSGSNGLVGVFFEAGVLEFVFCLFFLVWQWWYDLY